MTEESDKILVFVYGTLKKGFHANYKLGEDARLVGTGRTLTIYEMFGDAFPMIRYAIDGRPVKGEVYEVDKKVLPILDAYEGYPDFYDRKLVYVQLAEHNRLIQSWIYFIPRESSWVSSKTAILPNQDGDLVWTSKDLPF